MNAGDDVVAASMAALDKTEEEEVMRLAAVGMMPGEIAVAMEWPVEKRTAFCILAGMPGSKIARLIAAGRANGRATPQTKLHAAAEAGNIDAIKALQKVQAANRYKELLNHMDDDEFTD